MASRYPLGLDRVPNQEVSEYARRAGYLLVTKDAALRNTESRRGPCETVMPWHHRAV